MLDRAALKIVKPLNEKAAALLASRGITADQATLAGFAFGMIAAGMVVAGGNFRYRRRLARRFFCARPGESGRPCGWAGQPGCGVAAGDGAAVPGA